MREDKNGSKSLKELDLAVFTPKFGRLNPLQIDDVLRGRDSRAKYELIRYADLTKNSGLTAQIWNTLGISRVYDVIVDETTNPFNSRPVREHTTDYTNGTGVYHGNLELRGLFHRLARLAKDHDDNLFSNLVTKSAGSISIEQIARTNYRISQVVPEILLTNSEVNNMILSADDDMTSQVMSYLPTFKRKELSLYPARQTVEILDKMGYLASGSLHKIINDELRSLSGDKNIELITASQVASSKIFGMYIDQDVLRILLSRFPSVKIRDTHYYSKKQIENTLRRIREDNSKDPIDAEGEFWDLLSRSGSDLQETGEKVENYFVGSREFLRRYVNPTGNHSRALPAVLELYECNIIDKKQFSEIVNSLTTSDVRNLLPYDVVEVADEIRDISPDKSRELKHWSLSSGPLDTLLCSIERRDNLVKLVPSDIHNKPVFTQDTHLNALVNTGRVTSERLSDLLEFYADKT